LEQGMGRKRQRRFGVSSFEELEAGDQTDSDRQDEVQIVSTSLVAEKHHDPMEELERRSKQLPFSMSLHAEVGMAEQAEEELQDREDVERED